MPSAPPACRGRSSDTSLGIARVLTDGVMLFAGVLLMVLQRMPADRTPFVERLHVTEEKENHEPSQ